MLAKLEIARDVLGVGFQQLLEMRGGGVVVAELHTFQRESVARECVGGFFGYKLLENFAARLLCLGHRMKARIIAGLRRHAKRAHFGRTLAVAESGLGFAFLAVIVSYLPGINQAFSRREVTISLLDARAGSPPSAGQVLVRLGRAGCIDALNSFLVEWEQWSAELLESHLSFPVLSYFRSQHDNQSWLAAVTCMLDTCAVLMAEVKGCNPYRAELTFAMARHAAVDLSLIFKVRPTVLTKDRLGAEKRKALRAALAEAGLELHVEGEVAERLAELRGMYEPFVNGLAERFLLTLPPIVTEGESIDNWQRSPMRRAPGIDKLPIVEGAEEHFGGK